MKNRGFSIIEIVLVLGVIGILSTMIVPKTRNYLAMAKDTKAINILNNLRLASESYYLETGEEFITENIEEERKILKEELERLKYYLKESIFDEEEGCSVEIGGSKVTRDSKDIKYGGKIDVYIDKNKEIKFKRPSDINEFTIRGEKWEEL